MVKKVGNIVFSTSVWREASAVLILSSEPKMLKDHTVSIIEKAPTQFLKYIVFDKFVFIEMASSSLSN